MVQVCIVLPVVGGVEGLSAPLPADVGLRNPVDLTLEASYASIVHRHGQRVGVELGKSCRAKHTHISLTSLDTVETLTGHTINSEGLTTRDYP